VKFYRQQPSQGGCCFVFYVQLAFCVLVFDMKRFLGRRLGGKGGLNQRRLRMPVIESLHERVVYAADMQFVKDINTLPDLVGSTPAEFVQIGTRLWVGSS